MYKNKVYEIAEDDFKKLISESESYSDVLRKIGVSIRGNGRASLKNRINELNLDISHFIKYKNVFVSKYNIENAFVYDSKVSNQKLIKIILENNLKEYKCEKCGCDGNWNGKKLTLNLHHIDGDNKNNLIDNLQILCPNCHSITENFGNKSKDTKKGNCLYCNEEHIINTLYPKFCSVVCTALYNKENVKYKNTLNICKGCNSEFSTIGRKKESKFCSNDCYLNSKTTKLDISNEELKILLNEHTQKEVADKLGITKSSLQRYIKRNFNT